MVFDLSIKNHIEKEGIEGQTITRNGIVDCIKNEFLFVVCLYLIAMDLIFRICLAHNLCTNSGATCE